VIISIASVQRVLKPFKQLFGLQEKDAVASLHQNQICLPCVHPG